MRLVFISRKRIQGIESLTAFFAKGCRPKATEQDVLRSFSAKGKIKVLVNPPVRKSHSIAKIMH